MRHVSRGLDRYCTDPAQRLITVGHNLDHLHIYRDISVRHAAHKAAARNPKEGGVATKTPSPYSHLTTVAIAAHVHLARVRQKPDHDGEGPTREEGLYGGAGGGGGFRGV